MIPTTKVYENRPTLFANNWDRFGGRALDILNCFYVAQKLQINFKFFWPYNSFFSHNDPQLRFFSQDFLDRYRVGRDLDSGTKQFIDVNDYTFKAAKEYVASIDANMNLGILEFLSLPQFLGENKENCIMEYAACAISVMSTEVLNARDEINKSSTSWTSIHGRYGDLVDGDFKQYVPKSKYVNTLVYRNYIEQAINSATEIRFLSDSTSVVEGLEKISKRNLSSQFHSQELIETFGKDARDFIDILMMANSDLILAPNSSAYSILASRIGGTKLLDFQSLLNENSILEILELDIDGHYEQFRLQIRGKLKARDLVNLLQNHYKSLDFSTVLKLSHNSYSADGDYVYAACIWSSIQFLLGKKEESLKILARAETAARSVTNVHHDPLAVVLVTKFCLSAFETKDANLAITQELAELKTYQFSVLIAAGYLASWEHRAQLKFEVQRVNVIIRTIHSSKYLFKRLRPRKTRMNKSWESTVSSEFNEFLFCILDMLIIPNTSVPYQELIWRTKAIHQ